jgi:acetyltransferase-like isoleucine patch superfamily enzyme
MNRNHGVDYISTTPYLYNSNLGLVSSDTIIYEKCTFSDDVWVGHGAMILPSARYIGRGSVIGAGSVVTKDVEPYSIVAGNPARLIRMRFPPETIKYIESTSWWDWDIDELRKRAKKTPNLIFNPEGENR